MPSFLLLMTLIACGLLTAATAIALMAWGLIRPPRMTDGKAIATLHRLSPGDLGLQFENVEFAVRDPDGTKLSLKAWWIPAKTETGRCALLLHGYADAKVGVIAWAQIFHQSGFHILAIDLRAHGESGGEHTTAGFFERHDLAQVLGQLRSARPAATRQVILFGASLGAAVAVATAADPSLEIAGMVLDSPFADFRHIAMANYDRIGTPGQFFQRAALRLAAAIAKADFAAVAPLALLPKVAAPICMILPDCDPVVSDRDRTALRQAMQERANPRDVVWLVPECPHLLALQKEPAEYARRVGCFVDALRLEHDHVV